MFRAAFTSALPAKPQAVHTKRAWLSRDSGSTCPHAEHRWLVKCGLTFSTRPGALSSSRRTSRPHPDRRMPRFSPALARTFRPGAPAVPRANRVMPVTSRFSTRMRSNRRARPVLVFSAQSLRRSVSRAFSRAMASLTRPRRCEPAPGAGQRALQPPQPLALPRGQAGNVQQLTGRQGRAHGHAAVDADDLPVARSGDRTGNRRERDMPASRPVHGHPVGLHARRHRAGPAEPHPSGLRHPDLADFPGQSAHVPLPAAPPDDPEPLIPPGLAPRRPPGRVAPGRRSGHRPGEVPQRLLLHHLGAGGQPRVLRAGGGELPALLQVARRALAARAPVRVLLDGEVPDVPGVAAVVPQHRFLGGRGEQPVPGHANTLANATDISGEVKRRFLPGLKAGVSTPRS